MSLSQASQREAVDAYVKHHLLKADKGLENAYTNSTRNGLPMIAVSEVQGKFVSMLTTIGSARNVLEIGTLGGYSSIWFAQAMKGRGKVTSIEVIPHHRDVAIENLRTAGVQVPEEVDILLGAALNVLPKLAEEIEKGEREPFDFVFIDADWDNQWNYFDFGVKLSKGKGAVIYIDNAVRNLLESGIVGDNERDENAIDVVANVGADDRVDAVVMQTVGVKSHDGFLLAVVK
jgi:predicted O-methyltransferase YrrM